MSRSNAGQSTRRTEKNPRPVFEDGEQGPSTPHHRPGKYAVRKGVANQDGTDFEIKMCALVFLRAVQSNSSFTLTSNDARAGGFDDIAFSYGSPGNEQSILVQLKTSKKPINLITPRNKSLQYYFPSREEKEKISKFFKNYTYVFFTDADVNVNLKAANVDSPASKLLCTTWKPDNVCQVDLNDDICKDFKNETGAEDFVNRLLIFRSQSRVEYLDELIKQELFKMCNGFSPDYRTIQQTFVEKIKAWWTKEETKEALSENWEEWTQLKKQLFDRNKLLKQITFQKETLSRLEAEVLESESDIILLKSDRAEAQIACSKVYQTFIRKKCLGVLFTDISEPHESQNMLFNLWSKDVFKVLVITDVTNCRQNLGDNIANYICNPEKQNKKIVIVSSRGADELKLSQVHEFSTDFIKSTFSQLDGNSQHYLRNLEVDFQGKRIELCEIMTDEVLERVPLQDVLTSPKRQIGTALPACNEKYIPRTLSKRFEVRHGFIFFSNDFFLIAQDYDNFRFYCGLARGSKGNEHIPNANVRIIGERKQLYEAISGLKCCAEKSVEDPVHYIEADRNYFYWIHSHGSTDQLSKNIEWSLTEEDFKMLRDLKSSLVKEEDLIRKDFREVIVAGEPGSGKSALLLEVANKMKELNPHRWIIHIDLHKHVSILNEMKESGNVTRENVVRLLSKAANLDDSELSKQLLKHYVSESKDICILFDAFDEIAPPYTDTVLAIVKLILSEFKLSTLWIASRYNMIRTLEEELKIKVFRIEPLSDKEQTDFMSMLWGKENGKKFYKSVIEKLPFRVRSFPLLLKMMCEIDPDLDLSDNFSRISGPSDVVKLYDQFVEKKFDIYIKEKCELNCNLPSIETVKQKERGTFMERHMLSSLKVLGLVHAADESFQPFIRSKVDEFCEDIKKGNERSGITDGADVEPHFIHRTFAEHFAGKWLAENWNKNREMIYKISSEQEFQFVNMVVSLELDGELPAHLAVLNEDINTLRRLKKEDLNKRDVLGRTPLHLAVMKEGENALNVLSELLKRGPDLEVYDMFQHTPLFYAHTLNKYHVEKELRERGATGHF